MNEANRTRLAAAALGALFGCGVDDRAPDVAAAGANGGSGTAGADGGGGSGAGGNGAGGSGAGGSGAGGSGASGNGAGGSAGSSAGAGSGNAPGQGGRDAGADDSACNGGGGSLAAPCDGGTCVGGRCIPLPPSGCAVDVVSSVPFSTSWSSVGRPNLYDGGCDSLGTPEYALVFIAPQAGTYRVVSQGLVDGVPYTGPGDPSGVPDGPADGDSVMTVVRGSCAGEDAQQFACNDDAAAGVIDSQLDLSLSPGEVVTVYLNELTQTGGGTGTLSINLLP